MLTSALQLLESSPSEELLEAIETAIGIENVRDPPHLRQAEFLALEGEEVMFGGAVGGGKTEALLMWLREGVKHANFSGLFLRRTFAQLQGSPTTPIERSSRFFKPLGGQWSGQTKRWTFPNGSMVRFGHMQHELDKHNYDGPEFHRIAFDQVEQFTATQYEHMFSRLRRTVGYPIECGIRSAANPLGGSWVKSRFVTQEAIDSLKQYTAYDPSPAGMHFTAPCGAKFVPSRVADNPSIEIEEYVDRLRSKLGATLSARLANGDWSVVEGAIIDPDQVRYYTTQGDMLVPLDTHGNRIAMAIDKRECRRFSTIDTAGTSKQKAAEDKGKPKSFSVVATWDFSPHHRMLFLRHVWRKRLEWRDLKREVQDVLEENEVRNVNIENAHFGPALENELRGRFQTRLLEASLPQMKSARIGNADSAKHERAIASGFLSKIDRGEVLIPDVQTVPGTSSWMPEFESELLTWTGRPDEMADQIDVCSHACTVAGGPTTRRSFSNPIDTRLSARRSWR